MTNQKPHEFWVEQFEAAKDIKLRYGLKSAFDYLVSEKLLNFVEAANSHRDFARELPKFISHVRGLFTPDELLDHLARRERELQVNNIPLDDDEDEFLPDDPETVAKRSAQFALIKELLTVSELGTS